MKALVLALVLAVVSMKQVKEVKNFYSVDDEGKGVWFDIFVAEDGSTCRHLWESGQDYMDRWVECRWRPAEKVKAEAEPSHE